MALWVLRCFVVLCVRCSRCCCSRRGTKVGEAALDESDTARLLNPPAARLSDHRVQTWGTHVISLDELALYLDRPAPPMRSASCCDYILCRCCEDGFESRVKTYPAGMPHRLLLGITIDGLRRWLLEQVGHAPYADLAESGYLAQQRADAACANDGLSVCERLGRGWGTSACVGQADVYVCWAISSPISSLLEALESFLDLPHRLEGARGPPRPRDRDKTFFWISTFSLRNHTPAPAPAPPSREHVLYLTSLGLIIESIGHMVVLVESWEAPLALSRAHCLHEVALSYERKVRIELVMGDSARQKFAHAFAKDFDPMRQLLDRFSIVDLWEAQCAEARDAAFLREGAEVRGFAPAPEGSQERGAGKGRAAVNRQLRHVLRAALIRFARGTVARLSAAERPKSLSIDRLGTVRAYPTPPCATPSCPPSLPPTFSALLAFLTFSTLWLPTAALPSCFLPTIYILPGLLTPPLQLVKEAEVFNHRETLGDRHPTTLVAINNLAGLHMANGEMALAESLYRECLQARRDTLGSTHATTVISINNLGTLLSERGDFEAALSLVQEALAARRRELGPLDPATLKSVDNAGKVHRAQGSHARALACFEQALDGRRKVLGSHHIDTLRSMNHLGSTLYDRAMRAPGEGEDEPAADDPATEGVTGAASPAKKKGGGFLRSLTPPSSSRSPSPSKHSRSPSPSKKGGGGRGAEAQADPAEAAARAAEAFEKRRETDLERARGLFREALDGCRGTLGDRHPLTIHSMNNLGNILHACGLLEPKFIAGRGPNRKREDLLEQGTALLREALEGSKAVHGERHIETLIGSSNLGSALRTLAGDTEDSEVGDEATGLIRDAVAGIVDAKGELETMPLVKAAVVNGLLEQHPNLGTQSRAAVKQLQA